MLKGGGTFALVDNIAPDAESTPGFSDAELRDAALTYNAFEKIRDPSHARCLGMAEWSEVLSDTGFEIVHKERLPKDMEFQSWADAPGRGRGDDRAAALHADGRLAGAARPSSSRGTDGDKLWFTLDEAILIARKPA